MGGEGLYRTPKQSCYTRVNGSYRDLEKEVLYQGENMRKGPVGCSLGGQTRGLHNRRTATGFRSWVEAAGLWGLKT